MEKAKRKHSPEISQKRLTTLLLMSLILSVFFYKFPFTITLQNTFFNLPMQSYALIPLISLPLGIWSYRRYGFVKLHWFLIFTSLAIAVLIFAKLQPCAVNWAYRFDSIGFLRFFHSCDYNFYLF